MIFKFQELTLQLSFSETVSAQFFGHTHWDQLKLFYDEQRQATSVAYVGPSVTTWEGVDPAFRIYEIDRNEFLLSISLFAASN